MPSPFSCLLLSFFNSHFLRLRFLLLLTCTILASLVCVSESPNNNETSAQCFLIEIATSLFLTSSFLFHRLTTSMSLADAFMLIARVSDPRLKDLKTENRSVVSFTDLLSGGDSFTFSCSPIKGACDL